MSQPTRIVNSSVTLFLLLLAVAAIAPAYANWLAPPPPAVVATVDLEKVFNQINQRAAAEIELEQRAQEYTDQAEALRSEAELLKQDLELLVAGTKQYDNAEKKWMQAALDYRAIIEFSKVKLDALRAEARKGIYDQIITATAAFAVKNGIDFIITNDSALAIEGDTDMQIVQQLALRRVLYANIACDVTADLIATINQR